MIGAIVLAAGEGRRFGGPKQLAPLWGRPLLAHAVRAALASQVDDMVVVLGSRADEILDAIDLAPARVVRCAGWREGQAASLRSGLEALRDADAAVVMLGDQPLISAAAIGRVIDSRRPGTDAVRASYDDLAGHPVLFERTLFDRLLALCGDAGARHLLLTAETQLVACDGLGLPDDVDTTEGLKRLESEHGGWADRHRFSMSRAPGSAGTGVDDLGQTTKASRSHGDPGPDGDEVIHA